MAGNNWKRKAVDNRKRRHKKAMVGSQTQCQFFVRT